MNLHDVAVHPVEETGLEQDVVRDGHLADIMHQTAQAQGFHVVVNQLQLHADPPGDLGHPQGVLEGGMIAVGQHFVHDLEEIDDQVVLFLIGQGQGLFGLPAFGELLAQLDVGLFQFDGPLLNPDLQPIPRFLQFLLGLFALDHAGDDTGRRLQGLFHQLFPSGVVLDIEGKNSDQFTVGREDRHAVVPVLFDALVVVIVIGINAVGEDNLARLGRNVRRDTCRKAPDRRW